MTDQVEGMPGELDQVRADPQAGDHQSDDDGHQLEQECDRLLLQLRERQYQADQYPDHCRDNDWRQGNNQDELQRLLDEIGR